MIPHIGIEKAPMVFDLETGEIPKGLGKQEKLDYYREEMEAHIACATRVITARPRTFEQYRFKVYIFHQDAKQLIKDMHRSHAVSGYNIDYFDLNVLLKYGLDMDKITSEDLRPADLVVSPHDKWPSLATMAELNLGVTKNGYDPSLSQEDMIEYCKWDVYLTAELYKCRIRGELKRC